MRWHCIRITLSGICFLSATVRTGAGWDAGDRSKSFVDEVEAAWSEYAEGMSGEIDVEGKRTFTEFIREGVGVHAFNGEIFVQPVWDTETTQLFRTRFKAVSPKRVDTP